MLNSLIENHQIVSALWDAVNTSSGSLENVAPLVKRMLESGAWRQRIVLQLGRELVEFDSFCEFIETEPLRGCGWKLGKVEALIKDDPEVLAMWREATTGKKHIHKTDGDNITMIPRRGTSRAYALDRLKRERPDLFDKVCAGELSANKAAEIAGFRKRLTPFQQILKLLPKLTHSERAELKERLYRV